jgi:hypothetical protein
MYLKTTFAAFSIGHHQTIHYIKHECVWKAKTIPFQVWTVPIGVEEVEASRISRQSAAFTRREDPWYLFLLEAESTPGPYCSRKY